jgi:hypothetical protein
MDAIAVNSVAEEYYYWRRQKCACGGRYRLRYQLLRQQGEQHFDELHVRCNQCGAERDFVFDITSFFGREFPHE